jgi:hypothetical protein
MSSDQIDFVDSDTLLKDAEAIVAAVIPIMAGKHHAAIGAALASLTNIWARCISSVDPAETLAVRRRLVLCNMNTILDMMEIE